MGDIVEEEEQCPECEEPVYFEWAFCPYCGASLCEQEGQDGET